MVVVVFRRSLQNKFYARARRLPSTSSIFRPSFLTIWGVIQWPRNGPRTFYDRVRRFWERSRALLCIRNLLILVIPIQWTCHRIFARALPSIICPNSPLPTPHSSAMADLLKLNMLFSSPWQGGTTDKIHRLIAQPFVGQRKTD